MLLDLLYSEDIDIKDLEKYFLASSQGQAPGFSPKNFITGDFFFVMYKYLIKTIKIKAFSQAKNFSAK